MPVDDFLAAVRARETRLLRGDSPDRFRDLITVDALLAEMGRGAIAREHVRLTLNRQEVPKVFYTDPVRGLRPEKISQVLDQGGSLIVNRLPEAIPHLSRLADDVRQCSGERIDVVAFVTNGSQGALDLHFDNPDVLAIQVEGSKRWRFYGPPVTNPVRDMRSPPSPAAEHLASEEVVCAGDLLLVPAGCWHTCESGTGRSVHLSISFEPICVQRAMRVLAHHLLDNEDARRPLTRTESRTEAADAAALLKLRLVECIERFDEKDLIALHQRYGSEPRD
jgi:ribosomal protein L16 Arg81 hydroxylase